MKTFTKISSGLVLGLLIMSFASCKKDEVTEPEVKADLTVNKVADKTADKNKGETTVYYNLALNKQVKDTDAWDLSFKGTTISTSAGSSAQLVNGVFSAYTTAPTTGFATGAVAGWYKYTSTDAKPNHAILPIAGKIIIVKTTDGKYAKVEMISYYKGNPDTSTADFADYMTPGKRPASQYYTFNYVYQPDGSTNLK
ncbi:HmuY family protein [Pedobacter endophyticus]|uniref:HmuY family protein n=1 Tax=Pedobacter endophyticus TaxID=2789740 RepID=A0A7S9L0N7_9SPHI|nr:HmuY family protein [Pedobacter endophyticus]QPH40321.1 HmuY family protein [Pedobacter endophyticus]